VAKWILTIRPHSFSMWLWNRRASRVIPNKYSSPAVPSSPEQCKKFASQGPDPESPRKPSVSTCQHLGKGTQVSAVLYRALPAVIPSVRSHERENNIAGQHQMPYPPSESFLRWLCSPSQWIEHASSLPLDSLVMSGQRKRKGEEKKGKEPEAR
jgi:hypothetical protein